MNYTRIFFFVLFFFCSIIQKLIFLQNECFTFIRLSTMEEKTESLHKSNPSNLCWGNTLGLIPE